MVAPSLKELVEYGPAVEVVLDESVARTLMGLGVVDVTPALGRARWTVTPRGKVGAVRVGDVVVRVAPKVQIDRVVFLLDYALHKVTWTDRDVLQVRDDDLLHAVAAVFVRAADRALQKGLLQGYRTVEEALPVVRGRIRTEEQLRRRFAMPLPAEVRYDDYSTDTDENRLLRAATERLLRLPSLPPDVRVRLHRLLHRLADITPLVRGDRLPRWLPNRLNARYEPALRVADLVLAGSSFEHRAGEVPVSGFILDMPAIFEAFITQALRTSLAAHGGAVKGQHVTYLDDADEVKIRPDIVWFGPGGKCRAVVDAKYKAERPSGFPDADLYQALAYATALGLPEAHLVYARGNEAETSHRVRNVGIQIVAHALDLSATPAGMLDQVSVMAADLAARAELERVSGSFDGDAE